MYSLRTFHAALYYTTRVFKNSSHMTTITEKEHDSNPNQLSDMRGPNCTLIYNNTGVRFIDAPSAFNIIIDFTIPKCTFQVLKIASKLKKK